jgi:hypothetical protein
VDALGLFECQQQRFHGAVFHLLDGAALGGDTAPGVRIILLFAQVLPHAGVPRIAVYPLVVIPDQVACHGDIGDVGRGGSNTMGQSGDRIDADMGLQSGKDCVLPHHPPLRTVRESHPSYGSSLPTASLRPGNTSDSQFIATLL